MKKLIETEKNFTKLLQNLKRENKEVTQLKISAYHSKKHFSRRLL